MTLKINNQGAIAAPFTKREVVHTDDLRCWRSWQGRATLEAEKCGSTGRHAEGGHVLCTRRSAHREGQLLQLLCLS